ncbi:MAG: 16S rRNA (adenine(1518)-N(6)/adenine(1519)-N(6))-dimethyltransferase RsmA [Burkholderiaceae bacterium]
MRPSLLAGHHAKKRFGQNFLHDPVVIRRIISLIRPLPDQAIIEIGPGQGALTEALVAAAGRITAIELDQDLLPALRSRFSSSQLHLIAADVLTVDFAALADAFSSPLRIVGNLPYNISTPLLFHLLPVADRVADQTFMLQKEVVDRMVAAPGSKVYGRLSVMLQAHYRMEKLLQVPAGAFVPVPKVDSAIVGMWPLPKALRPSGDPQIFSRLVTQAFSARRKMLRNTLAPYEGQIDLHAAGLLSTQRPEEVSVAQYLALADQIARYSYP